MYLSSSPTASRLSFCTLLAKLKFPLTARHVASESETARCYLWVVASRFLALTAATYSSLIAVPVHKVCYVPCICIRPTMFSVLHLSHVPCVGLQTARLTDHVRPRDHQKITYGCWLHYRAGQRIELDSHRYETTMTSKRRSTRASCTTKTTTPPRVMMSTCMPACRRTWTDRKGPSLS